MWQEYLSRLGPVSWPLIVLSCLSLAFILERTLTYLMLPSLSQRRVRAMMENVQKHRAENRQNDLCANLCTQGHCLSKGVAVLLSHAGSGKAVREEVAGLWLLRQRQRLQAWLRFLMLIGVLSPMIGLLGTVIGMIDMFQGMAMSTGPVTPAVLADGLWVAMYTTAFGLIIAIPSLAASHGFTLWSNHYIGRLEFVLNHVNLLLEGVNMTENGMSDDGQVVAFRERAA